jgi:tetratricopeptide (TPR) repeat protein
VWEEQRVVRAMQLVAKIGDRATGVEPESPTFDSWYPVRLYEFTDGYFITAAHKSVKDLAGAQVLAIGGRPAAEAVDAARAVLNANSRFESRERLYAVHNAGLMRGIGLAAPDGSLLVKLRLRNGKVADRTLPAMKTDGPLYKSGGSPFIWTDLSEPYGTPIGGHGDWITAYKGLASGAFREPDASRPLHLAHRRVFHARALPERGAYYAQINYVSNSRDETYEDFFRRIMREVDQAKPRRLILDFRFNGGGDGSKAAMMAREVIKREDARPWKELYILIGRRTSGAAIAAVDALARNTPATLVGEPAGSPWNMASDSRSFAFPNTKLRLSVAVSTAQMSESTDLSETVLPDVPAPFSFADWAAGRDPAVDPILAGREMRSVSVIALDDSGAAGRSAYAERKSAFRRHDWWKPPRFADVKRVGYDLLRGKRAQDSADMFRLMTELYPDEWNSWESLGRAQTELGQKQEARESYRCALKLDPENWDSGDLKAALAEAPEEPAALPEGCPA